MLMEFSEQTTNWLFLDDSNPDQGRLYVSTEHRASPAVQSEIARALRLRPALDLSPVHLSELRRLQMGKAATCISRLRQPESIC